MRATLSSETRVARGRIFFGRSITTVREAHRHRATATQSVHPRAGSPVGVPAAEVIRKASRARVAATETYGLFRMTPPTRAATPTECRFGASWNVQGGLMQVTNLKTAPSQAFSHTGGIGGYRAFVLQVALRLDSTKRWDGARFDDRYVDSTITWEAPS